MPPARRKYSTLPNLTLRESAASRVTMLLARSVQPILSWEFLCAACGCADASCGVAGAAACRSLELGLTACLLLGVALRLSVCLGLFVRRGEVDAAVGASSIGMSPSWLDLAGLWGVFDSLTLLLSCLRCLLFRLLPSLTCGGCVFPASALQLLLCLAGEVSTFGLFASSCL
jgi:hypothetical protein